MCCLPISVFLILFHFSVFMSCDFLSVHCCMQPFTFFLWIKIATNSDYFFSSHSPVWLNGINATKCHRQNAHFDIWTFHMKKINTICDLNRFAIHSKDRLFMPTKAGKLIGNVISSIFTDAYDLWRRISVFSFSNWDEILIEKKKNFKHTENYENLLHSRKFLFDNFAVPTTILLLTQKKPDVGSVLREWKYSLAK